jgi:F-box protein 9
MMPEAGNMEEAKKLASDVSSADDFKEEAIWCKDDQDWLLTYNIWHMLPWIERKDISMKYGCKSIGEFEEYMSIRRALEGEKKAYPNEEAYFDGLKHKNQTLENLSSNASKECFGKGEQNEATREIFMDVRLEPNPDELLSKTDLIKVGGILLTLPEELIHYAFSFLSVDTFATLALVSPHWKHLCRTEAVYRSLCERIYLHQSKRRVLNVLRFGSYRNMLYSRYRVRNGLYVMRYAQVCL